MKGVENVSELAKKTVPAYGPVALKKDIRDSKSDRHSMRMYPDDFQKLVYWSEQFDMDRTEFLIAAMHHYIKWRNQDYDLPTAEIQRLNQMVDGLQSLVASQGSLETSVISGFNTMLGIIRGDNYLVDEEDGEL